MKALFIILGLATLFACDRSITTTTNVDTNQEQIQTPSLPTSPDEPEFEPSGPIDGQMLVLDPSDASIVVGGNVNIMAIVTDAAGQEVVTENLNVSVLDRDIAVVTQIDGRIVQIRGLAKGNTVVIFQANGGLTAALVLSVNAD